MDQQNGNMAPGQQNYPFNEEPQGNPNAQPGEAIREGAREEDQLDKLKENTSDQDNAESIGAPPDAYQYDRETTDNENENQAG